MRGKHWLIAVIPTLVAMVMMLPAMLTADPGTIESSQPVVTPYYAAPWWTVGMTPVVLLSAGLLTVLYFVGRVRNVFQKRGVPGED